MVLFFLLFSFFTFSQPSSTQENMAVEDSTKLAIDVFEKAVLFSPEILNASQEEITDVFIIVNDQKVYLNSGFWNLVKGWLRIYQRDIQNNCSCEFDPDQVVEEAKNHIAQGAISTKYIIPLKDKVALWSQKSLYFASKYGELAAILKVSAEITETIFSLMVGGKGVKIFCKVLDTMIFPFLRVFQNHYRVFSFGKNFQSSGLLMSVKSGWFSYRVRQAQNKAFLDINDYLILNESKSKQVDQEGFKHNREKWVEVLIEKSTPLLKEIKKTDAELKGNLSEKEKTNKLQQRKKLYSDLDKLTEVNRKNFFGQRYKRFLFAISRKKKPDHLNGNRIPDNVVSSHFAWPLALKENIFERALKSQKSNKQKTFEIKPDEIREGLVDEFLDRHKNLIPKDKEAYRKSINYFLLDIDKIFDSNTPAAERYLTIQIIEFFLHTFFNHYFNLVSGTISKKSIKSFGGKIQFYRRAGRFFYLIQRFSDFLSAVVTANKSDKAIFYKYESMENLLRFFDYLIEIQSIYKDVKPLNEETVLEKLNAKIEILESSSVGMEKRTVFSINPFKKPVPKCLSLTRLK